MDVKIIHNDHSNIFKLDFEKQNGFIQESILKLYNLIIYNIEYVLIYFEDKEFILGLDNLSFDKNISDFMKENNFEKINCIKIIDRKRDENDNVIKENLIIDKYNLWFQEKESNEYIEFYNNRTNNLNRFNNLINIFSRRRNRPQTRSNNQS